MSDMGRSIQNAALPSDLDLERQPDRIGSHALHGLVREGAKALRDVRARGRRRAQEARDFIRKIENDFSAIYKHTLRDEIAAQRLDLLCHALRASNEPIKTLVARSGFGDMSQATRVFKAKFGLTMNQFRNSRFPKDRQ